MKCVLVHTIAMISMLKSFNEIVDGALESIIYDELKYWRLKRKC